MSESRLLRFLDPHLGPVISLISVPYPSYWSRKLWHSRAVLAPNLILRHGSKVCAQGGSGWDKEKQKSQSKAITEAIERWALFYYSTSPEKAGLDIDNTSTGFAALPEEYGEERLRVNSYCEALERWVLNAIGERPDLRFESVPIDDGELAGLFKEFKGQLYCYRTAFDISDAGFPSSRKAFFSICLFKTREGGVLPGSACGVEPDMVMGRAMTEAFMHARAFERLKKHKPADIVDILEQRIVFFGKDPEGFSKISNRLLSGRSADNFKKPEILFSKRLPGPWDPEISVYRIILTESKPFMDGGVDRFLI